MALSRRERRDLEWSEMFEHKVTMLSHNIHFFPPFKTNEEDPETGEGVMEWEDNIRETVGWVSSIYKIQFYIDDKKRPFKNLQPTPIHFMQDALQSSSDFFYVREDECLDDYHEAIDDWPLVDPRTIDCNGRETQVYQESSFVHYGY